MPLGGTFGTAPISMTPVANAKPECPTIFYTTAYLLLFRILTPYL